MPRTDPTPIGDRVALVVGNADYAGKLALGNPVNDAVLMTATLKHVRFQIVGGAGGGNGEGANVDGKQFWALFKQFINLLVPGGTALIYYAGHAMQIGEKNYMVPIGVDLQHGDPTGQLVPLRDLVEKAGVKVGSNGTVILLLDACRNNPLTWQQMQDIAGRMENRAAEMPSAGPTRSAVPRDGLTTFKLTPSDKSAAMFIGLATAPGEVAFDGDPDTATHSPYAEALHQHLCTCGLDLESAFRRVASDVRENVWETLKQTQEPWSESNLTEPFYMVPRSMAPAWVLGLVGLLAGFVQSQLLFDQGQILSPVTHSWVWFLGLPFGLVAAWGSWQWGSGKPQDVVLAVFGPLIGFVLSLVLMKLVPVFPPGSGAGPLQPDGVYLVNVFLFVSAAACGLFFIGTAIAKRTNRIVGHAAKLSWFDHAVHWSLPLVMLAGLLVLQYLLTHPSTRANPALSAMGLHALAAGIIYASSAVVACKPQRSVFDGFGAFTGAIAVGILMAVFFAGFVWMSAGRTPVGTEPLVLTAFATLWHGVLGMQLGYCFAHYVPEHERPDHRGRAARYTGNS